MTVTLGWNDPSEDPSLAAIRPDDLSAYLASRGWRRVGEMHHMGLWEVPDREELQVLAPLETGYADFKRRLYELIRELSEVEDRSPDSVLRDLLTARADTIRIRVRPRGAPDSASIPLHDGVQLVLHAQYLLSAAARSADRSRANHPPGPPPGKVRRYLDRARLGQTEQGSFVVAITSPVSPSPEEAGAATLFSREEYSREEPFSRRVTQTLASGAKAARDTADAVAREGADPGLFLDVVEQGVSANLCEALAEIGRVQQGGFTVGFGWAALRPAPDLITAVEFGDDLVEALDRGATVLRFVDRGEFTLTGQVQHLKRNKRPGHGGRIRVEHPLGDPNQVWVNLGRDDYGRAVLAHHEEQWIRVSGRLTREGSLWELADPRDFTVVQGPSATAAREEPE